ncbi:MAG: hypothetical protein HZA22_12865 [Nitrospirae bacterium]|nr:hypothetical protein [Nitrospirota bacterium]
MKPGWYAVLALVLVALAGTICSLQLRIDASKGEDEVVEEFMRLPDAEYLKAVSLGFDEMVADVLWLKAVQHMGERRISGRGYDWIYTALDTVTSMDPRFIPPYETGGLILTIEAEKVDLSNRLLEKGMLNNPDVWQFPYYLGFNYSYFLKDYKRAARYIRRAAEMEGSPKYMPMLASRLFVQADDTETSIGFLQTIYERSSDERTRKFVLDRINKLRALNTARALQKVVDRYKEINGRRPADLSALVREGIIDRVPEEPSGGYYYIDNDGVVRSSKVEKSLGVHTLGSR